MTIYNVRNSREFNRGEQTPLNNTPIINLADAMNLAVVESRKNGGTMILITSDETTCTFTVNGYFYNGELLRIFNQGVNE